MLQKRSKPVLAVGVLALLLGGPLHAQDIEDVQLFPPADLSAYGSGPQPHEGYFFSFDGLVWSIAEPGKTPIGYPGSRLTYHTPTIWEVQTNDMDTGPLTAEATEGNRIEFGRVYGRDGWLFSTYRLNDQVQRLYGRSVDMVFLDIPDFFGAHHLEGWVADLLGYLDGAAYYSIPEIVDLPITFDDVLVENRVETWGVELTYLRRSGQLHRGGFLEFFAGARYLEFDETFDVRAEGRERFNDASTPAAVDGVRNSRWVFDLGPDSDPTATNWSQIGPGNVLADSFWNTQAQNHIIGPQIGGRWFRKGGRWTVSVDGRFFAGLNMQTIRNQGVLGSYLDAPQPWNWAMEEVEIDPGPPPITVVVGGGDPLYVPILRDPYRFDHSAHMREFSPGGELRLELMFELTRAVSVKAGWSGMWLGGIARASAMPDYTISDQSVMGINRSKNNQSVFVNGLNVGLSINR
jgi:hypothetical protein